MKINVKMVWLCTLLLVSMSAWGCRGKAKTPTSESAVVAADSGKEVAVVENKNLAGIGIEYCGG